MPKKKTKKGLKKKAWELFSKYIRLSEADFNGLVKCVTCDNWKPWKEIHAGHFFHAGKGNLVTYDERNVNPQCPRCNYYGKQGQSSIEYTLFIEDTYGRDTIDELRALKHQSKDMGIGDLESVIEEYKQKLKDLE